MALVETTARRPAGAAFAPFERRMLQALALVFAAGLLGASGALFVILLYGQLIPAGSWAQLGLAGACMLALMGLQALARMRAGDCADEASGWLVARLVERDEASAGIAQPMIRALRTRSFLIAADLTWVPVFLVVVLVLHPLFGLASAAAMLMILRFGAAAEHPMVRPDAAFRARERRRRLAVAGLRDGVQVVVLTLGGVLAIAGQIRMGEIVAATLLSLRAFSALSVALDDAPALRAAFTSWRRLRASSPVD